MLKLHTRNLKPYGKVTGGVQVLKVTENPNRPRPNRERELLILREPQALPAGYAGYLLLGDFSVSETDGKSNVISVGLEFEYLCEGDIVRIDPSHHSLNVIYRVNSDSNSLLVTERCNSYCLMCSQPPKDIDDGFILQELLDAIPMMSRHTREIGITGGEPTLLGEGLFSLVKSIKLNLPDTAIHILSNGRRFSKERAMKLAKVDHSDLMVGIPLYSDLSDIHDYVVQADGAYDETIAGILNLKTYGQKVEIRVVIHQITYERLPKLAEFIVRNLHFVDHVALMGLEMMGFTKANLKNLWIDPFDYQNELKLAVEFLSQAGMNVSIYNHQLCLLDPRLEPFSRKSISDWKNEYMPECDDCTRMDKCGGFFSSASHRYSDHIKPFSS